MLRDGESGASRVLGAHGVDLPAARTALGGLVDRGVVPGPRPSDAELLGSLGIDLEGSGGPPSRPSAPAVGWAIREATRARGVGWAGAADAAARPPLLISQALYHAGEQARTLGLGVIGPELLLWGVVTDIQTPWPRCMRNRWTRQLHASVGLPEGYRGAAGPLLESLGVDLDRLGAALTAEFGAGVRSGR